MPDQATKTCVLCGRSCVGQARIRNQKGEYAHQACAQAARIQGAADERAASAAGVDDDDALMSSLLDGLPSAGAAGEGGVPPGLPPGGLRQACGGCGRAAEPGVVVCVACGFDTRSGKEARTVVKAAPKSKKDAAEREPSALVFGATNLIGATIGAGVGAVIGAAVWAGVISAVQLQAGMIAMLVGALCGIGAAYGARANVGVLTGLIAVVFTLGAIVAGKWYGGSALGDRLVEKEIAAVRAEWLDLDDEGRLLLTQEQIARRIMTEKLEDGSLGDIKDFRYEMVLASADFPDEYPPEVLEAVWAEWMEMTPEEQDERVASLADDRVAELEARREEVRRTGFLMTLGVRDAVYLAVAILLAAGLGANENTAPFMT